MTSLEYIRYHYGVPALRGRKVVYRGPGKFCGQTGTIDGGECNYLLLRFEGFDEPALFHPTWELEYLPWRPS